jgi:hypothetical protein
MISKGKNVPITLNQCQHAFFEGKKAKETSPRKVLLEL